MKRFSRMLSKAFVLLFVVDSLAVTVLALFRAEYGALPLFAVPALGLIGLAAFKWIPRWYAGAVGPVALPPDAEDAPDSSAQPPDEPEGGHEAQLPPMLRTALLFGRIAVLMCQVAAVLTALIGLAVIGNLTHAQ